MSSQYTEKQVAVLLEQRFKDHACFRNFRTVTGYNDARYIDLVAVGMWSKNWGVKAFEIKVSRQDFFSDIAQFEKKQEDALAISNEFYYVCPHLMIDFSEVPKDAGLFTVMKNGKGLRRVKQAPYHKKLVMEMHYFMAFAREFGNKIDHSTIPVKYLGRDLSQEDFLELVKEERKTAWESHIKDKAEELNEKLHTENTELGHFRRAVKHELSIRDYPWAKAPDEELLGKLKEVIDFQSLFRNGGKGIDEARQALSGAYDIIQKITKEA